MRSVNNGTRKPMSEEAKAKIAESVRKAFALKRADENLKCETKEELTRVPELVRMDDLTFDPSIFITMKTGKAIDFMLSTQGGLTKSTNFIIVGDPGVGKTTVTLDILSDIHLQGSKVLFISAEMDRVDLYPYVQRYPKFGKLDILFLGEYTEQNPKLVVEEVLKKGYDVVLIDSFIEVQECVKEANEITMKSSEKWLIDLMKSHNAGGNESAVYTSFLAIQQINKGGSFVGSNKLKHNTHGMMEIRFGDNENRYVTFTKNRKGDCNKKMFFDLSKTESVDYIEEEELKNEKEDSSEGDLDYSIF